MAIEYNISLAILAGRATGGVFFVGANNKKEWDEWRLAQLGILKPNMIFTVNFGIG